MSSPSLRLDKAMVARGLAPTRSRAQAMIADDLVSVNDAPAKASGKVTETDVITIAGGANPYVSRAALKLAHAFDVFGLTPSGVAVDIGASTGGFTEVLLERGAGEVHAVEVGHGQMGPALAEDPRVHLHEGVNARALPEGLLPPLDWVVSDVSFISLEKALPPVLALAKPGAHIIALIKPQFEVGPEHVGKGGIVKDQAARDAARARIADWLSRHGWAVLGETQSPISGSDGNIEYLIAARKR